ncbi:hypothetical protein BDV40DRAFT_283555 [Aspergillus tamarii]|uniref:Chitin-binding type-2 domain-containing protein n=1 Tax=Aspergillus tamarii TaxID=41984 RepID=A0A5N6UAA3_ASPTM|nr:hypothetical protein BDV40DRAFT_283555 [Aspergillus tamarii]
MKLLLFALIASLTAAAGEPGATLEASEGSDRQCPPLNDCYYDVEKPVCRPEYSCSQWRRHGTACAWTSDSSKPIPHGCNTRCKPCKQEVCILVCNFEIFCTSGPCNVRKS